MGDTYNINKNLGAVGKGATYNAAPEIEESKIPLDSVFVFIRITEQKFTLPNQFQLEVAFEDTFRFEIEWENPLLPEEHKQIEWYFEEYMSEPYIAQTRVNSTINKLETYGEALFLSILGKKDIYYHFRRLVETYNYDRIVIELMGSSSEFHQIMWECMREKEAPPLASRNVQFVRKNHLKHAYEARVKPGPYINLLIVTARPGEEKDVNPHTIQRPLINQIADAGMKVRSHVLRPGTYQALIEHLREIGPEHYHIIHFDLHGSVLTHEALKKKRDEDQQIRFRAFDFHSQSFQVNWGVKDIPEYEGEKAFLFFESEEIGIAVPIPAGQIAQQLETARIPVCILNACQSAKQAAASKEQSLAKALIDTGMQFVLAMGYSISVTAANILMKTLYEEVLKGKPIENAITTGRAALYMDKNRSALLGQTIELEDWLLPIAYQNRPVDFNLTKFKAHEEEKFLYRQHSRHKQPKFPYGFQGRELDILKIEKLLIDPFNYKSRKHLLLRGMVGVGKSSLLKYLAWWWEETQWVEGVIFLEIGKRNWDWESMLEQMVEQISISRPELKSELEHTDPILIEQRILNVFRQSYWGLIIDQNNPDSINLREGLSAQVAQCLCDFLKQLSAKTFAIFGSRNDETWLSEGIFQHNVYQLHGLRKDEQYLMAKAIAKTHNISWNTLLEDPKSRFEIERLMDLMQGFPSVLAKVIPLLNQYHPPRLIEAYLSGELWEKSKKLKKTMKFKYNLFISYSHKDKKNLVEKLVKALEKKDIQVWYDDFEVKAGDSITDKISEGLRGARFGLIVISEAYVESRWARQELNALFKKQITQNKKYVLPIWYKHSMDKMMEDFPLLADYRGIRMDGPEDIPQAVETIWEIVQQESLLSE